MGDRLGAVVFAKLFPNPAEPYRGIFVADQCRATAWAVDWTVVAPVPWVPRFAARLFGKPYVKGNRSFEGRTLFHPRYPVLPRRLLYATVAPLIRRTARGAFRRAVAEVDARLVHVHDLYPSGAAAWRLCEEVRLPYVLTVHGLDLYSNLANPRWRSQIIAAARGAAAIVCVGTPLAQDCVAELGVDPARVLVIPNTYDTTRFVPLARERSADGAIRLATLGRLSREKGHDLLLRALAMRLAAGSSLKLTFIGDGPELPALEALADELGVGDHVTFTGTLLGPDVPSAFAESDVFVLPSRSEGFGVALIEALATGLPVVATRSGGPADIVGPDDGVLVEAGDASALAHGIADVVANLDRFDTQRIAMRAAERYSPEAVGTRLVRLYREVLAGEPVSGTLAEEGRP